MHSRRRSGIICSVKREMMIRKKLKEAVLNALLDANQIELPGSLIHGEEQKLREEIRQAMGQKGPDPATMQQTDDKLSAVAHRRVALQLILSDIINKNKLKTGAREGKEDYSANCFRI